MLHLPPRSRMPRNAPAPRLFLCLTSFSPSLLSPSPCPQTLGFLSRFLVCILTGGAAQAHHGRDFLVLQDFYLPEMLSGVLIGSFEMTKTGSDLDYGLEPKFLFGIFPGAALGVSIGFVDESGADWAYEDVMPTFNYQITPRDSDFPIRIAFSGGYQFARAVESTPHSHETPAARTKRPSRTTQTGGTGSAAAPGSNPDDPGGTHDHRTHDHGTQSQGGSTGADAQGDTSSTAAHTHSHDHAGSIHLHGQNAFIGTLIVEATLTKSDKLVFNLISGLPDDGEAAWGYAAGVRHNLTHSFSMSLEATGDFSSDGYQELNVGAFLIPHHNVTLRGGLGIGLTEKSPDMLMRTGVVWRF